ncbi:unnamed protein product [Protopolystoma xenopodis]|uniref:Uncharacterized protein n=1 Tax=Protopolystoma xenopodis TaxID=117903 RepID=A0A3S5FDG8_9PLAT|nr:unnamed protein product [Protopolystoma xenopodis]
MGLMLQNLIALHQGNRLYFSQPPSDEFAKLYRPEEHGQIINFWRCWKHFLIIHVFVKQEKMDPERAGLVC